MTLRFLFLDLDDTLLDFHKAEHIAVARAFRDVGVDPTPELLSRYSEVNKLHWQMLELGELTRAQVLLRRFTVLFQEWGIAADGRRCMELYEDYLCEGHYFVEGAEDILDYLAPSYRLFLASNGTAKVQAARLKSSGIGRYMERCFISEEMGADKPSVDFFKRCFAEIPDFDPRDAMIIGDSLTSDMRGGNNAGIMTCWFNPQGLPRDPHIHLDYEIRSLAELRDILKTC